MKSLQAEQRLIFYLLNKFIKDTYLLCLLNILNLSLFHIVVKKQSPGSSHESLRIFSSLRCEEKIFWICFVQRTQKDSVMLKIYFKREEFHQKKIYPVKWTNRFEEEVHSPVTQVLLHIWITNTKVKMRTKKFRLLVFQT